MKISDVKGSSGFPIVGDMLSIALKRQYFFLEKYHRYKSYFKTKTFDKSAIVLFGSDTCRTILSDKSGTFSSYVGWSLLEPLLGRGVLLEDGDLHLKHRSLIHSSFSRISNEYIYSLIYRITSQHLDKWRNLKVVPIYRNLKKLAFDIIFSLTINEIEDSQIKEDLEHCLYSLLDGQLSILRVDNSYFKYGKAMDSRRTLIDYCKRKIEENKGCLSYDSILSNMIKLNEKSNYNVSEDIIICLILQLLFAGYETTAKLGTYLILLLNDNPKYFDYVRNSSDQLFDTPNCLHKLESNNQLDQLLCEVERLYPPIYIIPRGLTRDFLFNDLIIPQDWLIYLSVSITHRLETQYQMPNNFIPERFSKSKDKQSLIGFGHGIHSCLGKEIAKIEVKTMLTLLYEKFDVSILPKCNDYKSAINSSSFVKKSSLSLKKRI